MYWLDLLTSAALGWTALVLAVFAQGWRRGAFLLVAIVALYRAVLFIHEITHRAGRDVPAFTLVWNTLVGVPLLIPSFLYEGVHTDHHRPSCYGTEADPEYVPFGRRPPALIVGSALVSLLAPVALALRFGILAPLSWAIPGVAPAGCRTLLRALHQPSLRPARAAHVRRARAGSRRVRGVLDVGWSLVDRAAASRRHSCAGSSRARRCRASTRSARWRRTATIWTPASLSMTEQLLDSCTISAGERLRARITDAGRVLVAPVGLRYHALHHWIPSLPYHNLGRVHRLLVSSLRADAPYRATIEPGFTPAAARSGSPLTRAPALMTGGQGRAPAPHRRLCALRSGA